MKTDTTPKPLKRHRKKVSKGITIPEQSRHFNDAEMNAIKNTPYKKKLADFSEKALERIKFIITLLELNGGRSIKGCPIAIHQLGIVLKSNQTAQDVMEGLCKSIMYCSSKHYDKTKNQPRRYCFRESFKMLGDNNRISKIETIETDKHQNTMKQESIVEQTESESVIDDSQKQFEDTAVKLINYYNTQYHKKVYQEKGISFSGKQVCKCCESEWPVYMYSFHKGTNILYDKCRVCFELGLTSDDGVPTIEESLETVKFVLNFINRKSVPKRNVRSLISNLKAS